MIADRLEVGVTAVSKDLAVITNELERYRLQQIESKQQEQNKIIKPLSKIGFTKDGAEFAKYKNISLVELKEIDEADQEIKQSQLQIGTLEISLYVTKLRPEIVSISIECSNDESIEKEKINIYQTTIKLSDGNQKPFIEFLTAFQNELHTQNKRGETITKRYEVPGGTLMHTNNSSLTEIKGITILGVLKQIDSDSNRTFYLQDKVWLIMKSMH